MRRAQPITDLDRTDAAFNRVLEAEARARDVVEDCRARAAGTLAEVAERARALERRTEVRLLRVHRLADASVQRELAALTRQGEAQVHEEPDAAARADLERLVQVLADEMIGAAGTLADSATPGEGESS